MKRFVAEQNIRHFEHLLASETDPERRKVLTTLLAEARRELADLDRAADGDRPNANDDAAGSGARQRTPERG